MTEAVSAFVWNSHGREMHGNEARWPCGVFLPQGMRCTCNTCLKLEIRLLRGMTYEELERVVSRGDRA